MKMTQSQIERQFQITTSKRKLNFEYSFRPIYIVSRIFGQTLFTFEYNWNGKINGAVIHKFDIVWLFILSIVNICSIYYIFNGLNLQRDDPTKPVIFFIGFIIVSTALCMLSVFSIIFDMCCREKFSEIIKKFIIFDKKVNSMAQIDSK